MSAKRFSHTWCGEVWCCVIVLPTRRWPTRDMDACSIWTRSGRSRCSRRAGLVPALTICLDLPVVEGLRRKQGGDQAEWNRMERERLDFQERVRRGYLALAAAEPQRWFVLDALREIEVIQAEIRQRVAALLP